MTPLAYLTGFGASEETLKLVPLLLAGGADPNVRTRFRVPILLLTIMEEDVQAVSYTHLTLPTILLV